jgi:hypothetical protein
VLGFNASKVRKIFDSGRTASYVSWKSYDPMSTPRVNDDASVGADLAIRLATTAALVGVIWAAPFTDCRAPSCALDKPRLGKFLVDGKERINRE